MAIPHLHSGDVVQLPLRTDLPNSKTTTIVKSGTLELIRLVLPAGKEIAQHMAKGEITVQCLEGRITFSVDSATQDLKPGDLIYLAAKVPHGLKALENSSVLVTLVLGHDQPS